MSKPEKVVKVGAVRASIFRNILQRNGQAIPIPKVVIEVRYRDASGQWKGTNSLSLNELPKAIMALQKAYDYLLSEKESSTGAPASSAPAKIYKGPSPPV